MKRVNVFTIVACLTFAISTLVQGSGLFDKNSFDRREAGGITFDKTENIRVVEEAHEISTKLIRVKSSFLNESDADVYTTVTFRVPPYSWADRPWRKSHPSDIVASLKASVDGRPVPKETVRKAIIRKRDVTQKLRELGFSERQIFATNESAFDSGFNWTPQQRAELDELAGGRGRFPIWDVVDTAFWKVVLPTGKQVSMEYSYEPVVGSSYNLLSSRPILLPQASRFAGNEEACVDDSTYREIEKRIRIVQAKNPKEIFVALRHVGHVLGTEWKWKRPIGKFTLRIEKDTSDQIVSVCFPGYHQKTSPTTVSPTVCEFVQKDFIPPNKLIVYFYTVGSKAPD